MALPALDAKVESNATSTGLTVSHTVVSGAKLLVVMLAIRGSQTATVTWNGTSMTEAISDGLVADFERTAIFYLEAPASGTHNVVVSLSGSVEHRVSVASFTADTDLTLDVVASSSGNSGNPNVTSNGASGAAGSLLVDCASTESNSSPPFSGAGVDQTVLHNSGTGSFGIGTSFEVGPGASETSNWTFTGTADTWAHVVAVFKDPDAVPDISFVAAGTAAFTATNNASLAPGIPAGMQAGDLMILVEVASSNVVGGDPSGWTAITQLTGNNGSAQRTQVYYRYWQSGDAAPTMTFTGTAVRGARIFGFRSVAAAADGGPFDATSTKSANAASATVATSSITTATDRAMVAFFYGYEDDPTAASLPAGYGDNNISTSTLGNDLALGLIGTKIKTPAGSENPSSTVSGGSFANSVNTGMLVALKPQPPAGPATLDGAATLAATQPVLTAAANRDAVVSATLASTPVALAVAGRIEKLGAATLAATAVALTAAGTKELVGAATLTGPTVALAAAGVKEKVGAATLAATAVSLAAAAERTANVAATLAASVSIAAAATKELVGAATLASTPVAIAVAGEVIVIVDGAATLAASAVTLAASGTIEKVGSATLAAASVGLSAAASRDAVVSATVTSPVSLAAAGERTAIAAATLAVSPSLTAAAQRDATGSATVSINPAIAASGQADLFASATLPIVVTVFASANNTADGVATLTNSVTLAASGDRTANVSSTLAAPVSITADATVDHFNTVDAAATLAITPTIAADSIRDAVGSAIFTVSTIFTVAVNKDANAVATLPLHVAFSAQATVQPLITTRPQAEQDAAGAQLKDEWAALVVTPRGASGRPHRGWGPKRGPGATR